MRSSTASPTPHFNLSSSQPLDFSIVWAAFFQEEFDSLFSLQLYHPRKES